MKPGWVPGSMTICLLLAGLACTGTYAQSDTVMLQQVIVTSNDPSKYLPGGKQLSFETDSISLQNLGQAIEDQAAVYFIQYGAPGQLSSINLRGLGAYRTSVRWQGMEINSFTLGQTDFSEIAAGNGDVIDIQYGGVGSMFGNGALGGTVEVKSKLRYSRGHGVSVNSSLGSYGYRGIDIDYRYSNQHLSSSTKLFRRAADNDFEYQLGNATHRQQNAAFLHYGLMQDLAYRFNGSHQVSLHLWYNNHFREIQSNKSDLSADEELDTENTRVAVNWQWNKNRWSGGLQTGYSDDYQLYDRSEITRLYRWFGAYQTEWIQSEYLTLRVGGNFNYLKPRADAYQGNTKETRSELYGSVIWEQVRNLALGVSLRTPMANGQFKTVSPLLSAQYLLVKSQNLNLSTDFQMGKSYRLPTLNDLYWQPGGNIDLKPEISRNLEAGMDLTFQTNRLHGSVGVRAFRHAVDNWIIWIPGGSGENTDGEVISFWYPDNIREVLAYGVDYQHSVNWQLPVTGLRTSFEINGVYNKAVNKRALSPLDRSRDKQLPYTPLHVINANWKWFYKTWFLGVMPQYRSKRFVETNNELSPLSAYTLWRFSAGKNGTLGPLKWGLQFTVNNAFDEVYETYQNRAMPGSNYQLNLSITYNHIKK